VSITTPSMSTITAVIKEGRPSFSEEKEAKRLLFVCARPPRPANE